MQALLTTTATLFLPCQRRPEISQVPAPIPPPPPCSYPAKHRQLTIERCSFQISRQRE